jgi:geranylgeranyl pyrophosphate synthase
LKPEEIREQLLDLPEVAAWPEMANTFERALNHPKRVWEWCLLACQAVGGDLSVVTPGAAAALCMMLGITLVDDMLDDDPRGLHLQIGWAATANLALAFQAAAFRLIASTAVPSERRVVLLDCLAEMALATAFGQNMDMQNLAGEDNYWKIVRAKSTPFYAALMYIGAVLGQATPEVAARLRHFGVLSGEVVQLHDDLNDAMQSPANPDWGAAVRRMNRNSSLILYALTANHPEREAFRSLLPQIAAEPCSAALRSAQQILIRCGAVSYCLYHVVKRYEAARQLLDRTPLVDPAPVRRVLAQHVKPLIGLLERLSVAVPPELAAI